jgi:hypothetical protein
MFLGSRARPVRTADNLTAVNRLSTHVESLISHNPIGLQSLLQGKLYFFFRRQFGRESQMGAWQQYRLADWLSVVRVI